MPEFWLCDSFLLCDRIELSYTTNQVEKLIVFCFPDILQTSSLNAEMKLILCLTVLVHVLFKMQILKQVVCNKLGDLLKFLDSLIYLQFSEYNGCSMRHWDRCCVYVNFILWIHWICHLGTFLFFPTGRAFLIELWLWHSYCLSLLLSGWLVAGYSH